MTINLIMILGLRPKIIKSDKDVNDLERLQNNVKTILYKM